MPISSNFDFWSYVEGYVKGSQEIIDLVNQENQPRCKLCGSTRVAKHGEIKGVQRYRCNNCGRTYLDNENLPDMKTSKEVIASAINLYYLGLSFNKVRRQLELTHNISPSVSTLYYWVTRYSRTAINNARLYTPNVGDVWIADETALNIGKSHKVWFWDLIDTKTRFLLASHISTSRTTKDAKILAEKAYDRAGKPPKFIVTDKLQAYLDAFEQVWGADTVHLQSMGLSAPHLNTNLIERFHGSIKDRTKVMRGLRNLKTAKLFTDGWLVHYNFFRPHETLKGKTPAEKAGIRFPFKNWGDAVESESYPIQREKTESDKIWYIRDSPIPLRPRYRRKPKPKTRKPERRVERMPITLKEIRGI